MAEPPHRCADRLRTLFESAARHDFPPSDWALELLPAPEPLLGAAFAFTAHHVLAAPLPEDEVAGRLDEGDTAAPFAPAFLAWVGTRLGAHVGHVDAVLSRMGTGTGEDWLHPISDPPDNERVRRARALRREVRYFGPPGGGAVVTLGEGLAGRCELSMEIGAETARGRGLGTRLVTAAVCHVPSDRAVFASVAPGNVRSLRCLLAAGFEPVAAECLFTRTRVSAPRSEPHAGPSTLTVGTP